MHTLKNEAFDQKRVFMHWCLQKIQEVEIKKKSKKIHANNVKQFVKERKKIPRYKLKTNWQGHDKNKKNTNLKSNNIIQNTT